MKPTATKFFASVTKPCLDWLGPFSVLIGIATVTVFFFGLALLGKTLAEPFGLVALVLNSLRHSGQQRTRGNDGTPNGGWSMKLPTTCLLLSALVAGAQPAQIILLRHAEKPDDAAALNLSPRGEERARALIALLGRGSPFTSNAPVAALYATRVTKREHSRRTGETLAPLSKSLGLPVNTLFDSDNYSLLTTSVLNNPVYRGKTVIVCWTHHDIAQLAGALGVRPQPVPWKDKTFDRLWIISFRESRAELRDAPQRLLKGDAKR